MGGVLPFYCNLAYRQDANAFVYSRVMHLSCKVPYFPESGMVPEHLW